MDLLEPFTRMLASACPPTMVRGVEAGEPWQPLWAEIAESGFLDALVAEGQGGAGLSLAEVEPLFEALGAHAVPLPVGETMIARALLSRAGIAVPDGPVALASSTVQAPPCLSLAMHVLIDDGEGLRLTDAAGKMPGTSVPRPVSGLRPLAAILRAAQIAGAAGRLLETTVAYANERVQFGKPIGRQQALQQGLAVMAEDAIAARIAARLGCAGGIDLSVEAAATAKSVASAVAARVATTAHAVHGAIGISGECDLQLLTRRLHEWRLADGSEGYWNAHLGRRRLDARAGSVDWVRDAVFQAG